MWCLNWLSINLHSFIASLINIMCPLKNTTPQTLILFLYALKLINTFSNLVFMVNFAFHYNVYWEIKSETLNALLFKKSKMNLFI